jgi:hypothetical protein
MESVRLFLRPMLGDARQKRGQVPLDPTRNKGLDDRDAVCGCLAADSDLGIMLNSALLRHYYGVAAGPVSPFRRVR